VAITDTTPEAAQIQLGILRAMTGEQRLKIAFEMCRFAGKLAAAGIRQEHPEWSERQIKRELLRLAFLPKPLPPLPDEF
jgi:hypothetical protein